MKLTRTIFILLAIITSCTGNQQSDWESANNSTVKPKRIDRSLLIDISKFDIDTTALHDQEAVKIICASEALFPTDQVDFYIHTVAISLETGDTVNVLATGALDVSEKDPYGKFLSQNSEIAKVLQNIDQLEDGVNVNELFANDFDKVFSDPLFINLETSNFPSIVGMIGEVKSTK